MRLRSLFLSLLAMTFAATISRAAGDLNMTANATGTTQITLDWSWTEYDPSSPVTRPDWVGYDLYRRDPSQCSDWVRMNAGILPRVPGVSHSGTFVDTPPVPQVTWEYKLIMVDAARNEIILIWPEGCEPPCEPHAWESIPKLAGPVTIGSITQDLGWAVIITPCANGCWYTFVVSEPGADALRPYLGSGETFRFYGDELFGTFEGSSLTVDHFELAACAPVATTRSTWGRVKVLYR